MAKTLVAKTSDIPVGKMQKFSINGKEILVANVAGEFFAIADTCTHSGASLSEGQLDGCSVICGWHGAKFDCKTGKLEKFPAKINDLSSYTLVVEEENLFLEA